ncbi:MAG: Aspartate-semialdehyde dehydrogenase 2 [Chlamydiae bacterium]|nr:Aspartate-semialdehyde dehydrogenase 2 [Chlamydiota bacterium]
MEPINIAIVGSSGAVGTELQELLTERNFPQKELHLYRSSSNPSFAGVDLAFFCVSEELAKELIPKALQENTLCIDASSAYRMDPSVPLVIPEINTEALKKHSGIIASPNCTTTLMLLPLASLHQEFHIRRVIATTYQAVSGAGAKGLDELKKQTEAHLQGIPLSQEVFPYPCAFNVFLHESPYSSSGYCEEEEKMHEETQKILGDPKIQVSATCVRVPVFRVHSLSLNVEFEREVDLEVATKMIGSAEGVELIQDWDKDRFPTAVDAQKKNRILCGRIRSDHTHPRALEMWVVGDQLLKGAALNMIQIAETLYAENP